MQELLASFRDLEVKAPCLLDCPCLVQIGARPMHSVSKGRLLATGNALGTIILRQGKFAGYGIDSLMHVLLGAVACVPQQRKH
jgi:hypothetical protein